MALYEVQKNDTLYSISRKYPKMTIEQLKDLNKEVLGGNPNILKPGSKLKVIAGS
jgi:LysM repeat protein